MLELKDVHVFRGRKEIVKGVSLKIREGERHVLMGPNGSGKSTLALAIMGSPRYKVKGKVTFEGRDLTRLPPEERAREGIFLAFQHPPSIQGVRVYHFMRELKSRFGPFDEGLVKEFMDREVNVGFSGGEKKRFEIAQLLALKPKLAIIDEVDAGLDVDMLKRIRKIINGMGCSFLIITHTGDLVKGMRGLKVHIMVDGRIVKEGGSELIREVKKRGYGALK
ncbi:MAG TPA: ABC transporter ATP-binding protein [Candidatus Aenigmarchaeota archaeon]|nr:ABC transporter ATP-binding protein [Candidatus Aenigmarchaeota archaeon]